MVMVRKRYFRDHCEVRYLIVPAFSLLMNQRLFCEMHSRGGVLGRYSEGYSGGRNAVLSMHPE